MSSVCGFSDLDGGGSSGESRKTGFESGDLRPLPAPARINPRHTELVRCARLEFELLLQFLLSLDVNFRLLQVSVWKIIAGHGAGGALDDANIEPGGFLLPVLDI